MGMQLSFFETDALDRAADLLELLNADLKPKERFKTMFFFRHENYIVFVARNRNYKMRFNVLSQNGEIPEGMGAEWRSLSRIKKEINL